MERELTFLGLADDTVPYVSKRPTSLTSHRITPDELASSNSSAAAALSRKICWLMQADYCCLGYPFPVPCADFAALC
jgi:hypothetical protein